MTAEHRAPFAAERDGLTRELHDRYEHWAPSSQGLGGPYWSKVAGDNGALVGSEGRLGDFIVLGHPRADDPPAVLAAVEAALFETGTPVLIAPPRHRCGSGIGR